MAKTNHPEEQGIGVVVFPGLAIGKNDVPDALYSGLYNALLCI